MWDKVWMNPVAGPSQPRSIFGAADRGGYELGTKGIRSGNEGAPKERASSPKDFDGSPKPYLFRRGFGGDLKIFGSRFAGDREVAIVLICAHLISARNQRDPMSSEKLTTARIQTQIKACDKIS